ncbi:MAG: RimK/LysX family protein [Bacteroidia bacterium]
MVKTKKKQIIGRREIVGFPELGLDRIVAKIDTGAYTSALYCHDIREENGILIFKLLSPAYTIYNSKEHRYTNYGRKEIKNSFGEIENRFTINTIIIIGGIKIKSVISLTDRSAMRYPVLIGRKILKNRFVVDVSLPATISSVQVKHT